MYALYNHLGGGAPRVSGTLPDVVFAARDMVENYAQSPIRNHTIVDIPPDEDYGGCFRLTVDTVRGDRATFLIAKHEEAE